MKTPENTTQHLAEGILQEADVIRYGHFIGASGLHLDTYVQKDRTITDPTVLQPITNLMAKVVTDALGDERIDALVGIAPCSSQLATGIAQGLGALYWESTPQVFFAEKVPFLDESGDKPKIGNEIIFKRGFDKQLEGKSVLLVEDVLTTASSLKQLLAAVQTLQNVHIAGAVAEFNRSPAKNTAESIGVPILASLINKEMPSYTKPECPCCTAGIPINTELGHGAKYLAELANADD